MNTMLASGLLSVAVSSAQHEHANQCRKPPRESTFNSIVEGLLREGSMPPGDVLDVGANTGEWTCLYACVSPSRLVHAVDPSAKNIRLLRCADHIQNVRKARLALSAVGGYNITGPGKGRDRGQQLVIGSGRMRPSAHGDVPVSTVDELFGDSTAGFMHIDVEGHELDVLLGGGRVVSRDRPIFSVEAHLRREKKSNKKLFNHITALQYTVFVVHEVCGWFTDCRNLLCIPDERLGSLAGSAVLNLAVRSGVLVKVNLRNITEYTSAAPLRGFYDARGLLSKPGQYVCNKNSRTWKSDKPCSTANTQPND